MHVFIPLCFAVRACLFCLQLPAPIYKHVLLLQLGSTDISELCEEAKQRLAVALAEIEAKFDHVGQVRAEVVQAHRDCVFLKRKQD